MQARRQAGQHGEALVAIKAAGERLAIVAALGLIPFAVVAVRFVAFGELVENSASAAPDVALAEVAAASTASAGGQAALVVAATHFADSAASLAAFADNVVVAAFADAALACSASADDGLVASVAGLPLVARFAMRAAAFCPNPLSIFCGLTQADAKSCVLPNGFFRPRRVETSALQPRLECTQPGERQQIWLQHDLKTKILSDCASSQE